MKPLPPDSATIQALRSDLALQIARHVTRSGETQTAAARRLGIPQPTLSKIMRSKVSDLSLELLIRIAVRAKLPLVLQTGTCPDEAGVYLPTMALPRQAQRSSKVAQGARDALLSSARRLTPEQRLEAHLKHNELMFALHQAGKTRQMP